ncbi:stromal cell-derived factor 2-like protein 1 isoform X1 [Dunckerocampus dactyliophorus]|uniref:stromal cell-derived factor 2-like protein 1 isoform X1 n=1 Tax=Dunckerocampus dactyliophorus TaxID=161453 RepID=UPI0024049C50|nr:stromal cell-derived factor 2-like protein 1 isoform X1 [Dunckerocampus dactyliophorus]
MEMSQTLFVKVVVFFLSWSHYEGRESEFKDVTCGSLVKLLNTRHNVRLHSHDVKYGSDKTKEMIIDPRTREKEPHKPLFIDETEVERVKTFKFLGTHISEDLTWSHNTQQIMKKSQRRLYFLRRLRKFGMSTTSLSCFYRCTIESVLTASITVWYGNCTTRDRKALQRVIKTSQNIVGAALPSLQDIYKSRVLRRTHNLIKDSTHPQHSLFTLLPSGRRYRSLKSRSTRLANSFYPQAIRLLNEALTHAARNTLTHS